MVLAASLPECFFSPFTHPAVNPGVPEKPITGPAPEVRQRGCPRSIADRLFFHHSHALPSILGCPGLPLSILGCPGLPLSILGWAQDCFIPVLTAGLPRCTMSSSGLELFLSEHRLVM